MVNSDIVPSILDASMVFWDAILSEMDSWG